MYDGLMVLAFIHMFKVFLLLFLLNGLEYCICIFRVGVVCFLVDYFLGGFSLYSEVTVG